jgi:hypothetical protein
MSDLLAVEPHRRVRSLLPWYAQRTLDPAETRDVAQHLADCATCRAALAEVQQLAAQIANSDCAPVADTNTDAFDLMRARIAADSSAPQRAPRAVARAPRWLWLALAAQCATVAVLWPGSSPQPSRHAASYRTLAASPTQVPQQFVRVVFDPALTEAALRRLLGELPAQIANGPSAYGVYTLRVAAHDRERILQSLRTRHEVRFAEPASDPS